MSKNKVERDCIQNKVYMGMNSLSFSCYLKIPHYSLLKSWQTDKKIVVHFTIYYSPVLNNLQTCNFHFANGSFKRQLQVTQFISFHHSFKCHFNYLKRCQLLTSYDIKDRDFMTRAFISLEYLLLLKGTQRNNVLLLAGWLALVSF